ncbi:MAG: glycoside hydrolase family 38 C-terminal domain-containing protein, partial [Spirochaetia bacterium]
MPQILSGCGMHSYIFCRPALNDFSLPLGGFRWRDSTGSEITARRSDDHYLTSGSNITEKLDQWLEHYKDEEEIMILWGIGNHGGGPSQREYEAITAYTREHPEYELIHSTTEQFMERLVNRKEELPSVTGEIQECSPGCYTSMARLKRAHRQAEGLYYGTENIAAYAWWTGLRDYPAADLETCLKDILFAEFHDILPGSAIERVENESIRCLSRSMEELSRTRFQTVLSILSGDLPAENGTVPIYLINPNPFSVNVQTEAEYNISHRGEKLFKADISLTHNGEPVQFQRTDPENNLNSDWRPRVVLNADLGPGEIRRIDAAVQEREQPEPPPAAVPLLNTKEYHGAGVLCRINGATGLIDALTDGKSGSLLLPGAFVPKVYPDTDHSWVSGDPEKLTEKDLSLSGSSLIWDSPSRGTPFRLAGKDELKDIAPCPGWNDASAHPVRILEDGPLRAVIETVFVLDCSVMIRRYIIPKTHPYIEIRERIYWNHRDSILRISLPLTGTKKSCLSESLYSAAERNPSENMKEYPNQRWIALKGKQGPSLTVCSADIPSHSFTQSHLELNLLRSPAYSSFFLREDHPWHNSRFHPRQDQGHHTIVYRLYPAAAFSREAAVRNGTLMNQPVDYQVFYPDPADHTGKQSAAAQAKEWIRCDNAGVLIRTVKKAENDNALVVRIQESGGEKQDCRLYVSPFTEGIPLAFAPWELKTVAVKKYRSGDSKPVWKETNLVEGI